MYESIPPLQELGALPPALPLAQMLLRASRQVDRQALQAGELILPAALLVPLVLARQVLQGGSHRRAYANFSTLAVDFLYFGGTICL